MSEQKFPLYLMRIDDRYEFVTIHRAAAWYDSGWNKVDFGGFVIEDATFKVRRITDQEKRKISDMADEYSTSK